MSVYDYVKVMHVTIILTNEILKLNYQINITLTCNHKATIEETQYETMAEMTIAHVISDEYEQQCSYLNNGFDGTFILITSLN